MRAIDLPKIDGHCHVLDPVRFPYAPDVAYRPQGQEIGTADYFVQVMKAYGVEKALLVGPNSGYGTDNRCLLDALARYPQRFKGVAVVPASCTLAELELGQASLAELEQVSAFACAPGSDLHHLPFAVAPSDLLAALVSTTSGERQPA